MVVRVQPLGLLSVRMKEYEEKQKFDGGKSEDNHTSKEGQSTSPGMLSVTFDHLRSRALHANRKGGYPTRTTVHFEI